MLASNLLCDDFGVARLCICVWGLYLSWCTQKPAIDRISADSSSCHGSTASALLSQSIFLSIAATDHFERGRTRPTSLFFFIKAAPMEPERPKFGICSQISCWSVGRWRTVTTETEDKCPKISCKATIIIVCQLFHIYYWYTIKHLPLMSHMLLVSVQLIYID